MGGGGGGRVSGWEVSDTQGTCMYIFLCVSVYVNMYLRVWYRNSSSPKQILYQLCVILRVSKTIFLTKHVLL